LYVPQVGQMRWARFGDPHCGHVLTRGASMLWVARRWSRRAFDVFLLGTAMASEQCSYIPPEPPGSTYD
jgi:hypothetical protein